MIYYSNIIKRGHEIMTDAEMKEFLSNPEEYNKKQHQKAWKPYNDAVQSSSLRSVHNKMSAVSDRTSAYLSPSAKATYDRNKAVSLMKVDMRDAQYKQRAKLLFT